MSHCFAVGSIAERTPAKYLYLPTFMFCCQKMAIKIKEIKPHTVSVECLCTHVIVVHSMKLMIRSTSPFERGPGGMPVDLLLWFFNNVPSRVNTHTHTHNRNRIHILIRIRNSFTKGAAPSMLRVSLLCLKHRSRRSLNCRAERSTYNRQQRLSQRQRQRQRQQRLQIATATLTAAPTATTCGLGSASHTWARTVIEIHRCQSLYASTAPTSTRMYM